MAETNPGCREDLDRYPPVQALVVAVEDLAHAASAEQSVYPVPPGEHPFLVRGGHSVRPSPLVSRCISARSFASASSRAGSVMIR